MDFLIDQTSSRWLMTQGRPAVFKAPPTVPWSPISTLEKWTHLHSPQRHHGFPHWWEPRVGSGVGVLLIFLINFFSLILAEKTVPSDLLTGKLYSLSLYCHISWLGLLLSEQLYSDWHAWSSTVVHLCRQHLLLTPPLSVCDCAARQTQPFTIRKQNKTPPVRAAQTRFHSPSVAAAQRVTLISNNLVWSANTRRLSSALAPWGYWCRTVYI